MNYLEALGRLEQLENSFEVGRIRVQGVCVWPWLRLYLFQVMAHTKNEHSHEISAGKVKTVLRSLFAFNPLAYLRRRSVWVFNGAERRKEIKGKYIHRVSGFVPSMISDALCIEKPSLAGGHRRRSEIEERHIVSESWILLASHAAERLLRFRRPDVEGADVMDAIISELGVAFDYRYFIRFLLAQRSVVKCLMRVAGRPDTVVIECPYTVMGYLWAFHDRGVRVIELQHGVAGESHYAYVWHHSSVLYPDTLCVFGKRELDYFTRRNPDYAREVVPSGLYILEKCSQAFDSDPFASYRDRFRTIVVFAGQDAVAGENVEFLVEAARKNPETLFIYVPRTDNPGFPPDKANLLYRPGINIYEYLMWCDIHCTVYSTTCLESAYYGRPTVFHNLDNYSMKYYGDYLEAGRGVEYIDSPDQFAGAVSRLEGCGLFEFPEAFSPFRGKLLKKLICGKTDDQDV